MKSTPDVLGMRLDDALALLKKEGLACHWKETKPVKPIQVENASLRVIRVLFLEEDGIELTVCNI